MRARSCLAPRRPRAASRSTRGWRATCDPTFCAPSSRRPRSPRRRPPAQRCSVRVATRRASTTPLIVVARNRARRLVPTISAQCARGAAARQQRARAARGSYALGKLVGFLLRARQSLLRFGIDQFTRGLQVAPRSAELLFGRAMCLFSLRRYQLAAQDFEEVLAVVDKNALARAGALNPLLCAPVSRSAATFASRRRGGRLSRNGAPTRAPVRAGDCARHSSLCRLHLDARQCQLLFVCSLRQAINDLRPPRRLLAQATRVRGVRRPLLFCSCLLTSSVSPPVVAIGVESNRFGACAQTSPSKQLVSMFSRSQAVFDLTSAIAIDSRDAASMIGRALCYQTCGEVRFIFRDKEKRF